MSMLDYFAYNPLQKRKLDPMPFGDAGVLGDPYEFWAPSDAMWEQDQWRARNWSAPGNFKVLDADEATGAYKVMVKSGDKEGTVYQIAPDDKGGYRSQEIGKEGWDTNKHYFKDPLFRAFLATTALMGGGALAQNAGLLGSTSAATPVAESFPVTAYGPAVTAPLAPATITADGLAIGGAGLAGPYVTGSAAGAAGAAGSAGAAGAAKAVADKTLADQIASWLGVPTWAVQLGGGLLGGAAGYLDAKRQEGKIQGGAPEVYAEGMSLLRSARPREPNAELMSRALGLLGTGSTLREVTGRTQQNIDDLLAAYGRRRSLL